MYFMLFIYKKFSEKVHRQQQSDKGFVAQKGSRTPALWRVDCMGQSPSSHHGTIHPQGYSANPHWAIP